MRLLTPEGGFKEGGGQRSNGIVLITACEGQDLSSVRLGLSSFPLWSAGSALLTILWHPASPHFFLFDLKFCLQTFAIRYMGFT